MAWGVQRADHDVAERNLVTVVEWGEGVLDLCASMVIDGSAGGFGELTFTRAMVGMNVGL